MRNVHILICIEIIKKELLKNCGCWIKTETRFGFSEYTLVKINLCHKNISNLSKFVEQCYLATSIDLQIETRALVNISQVSGFTYNSSWANINNQF